jgi:uncharacterized membrane protein
MSREKLQKDLEFFSFCWQMMRGTEGYVIAAVFWLFAITLLIAIVALGSVVVQGFAA